MDTEHEKYILREKIKGELERRVYEPVIDKQYENLIHSERAGINAAKAL